MHFSHVTPAQTLVQVFQPQRQVIAQAATATPQPTAVAEPTQVAGTPEPTEVAEPTAVGGTPEPTEVAGPDTNNVQEQVGDQQGATTGGPAGVDNELPGGPDTDNVQEGDQQDPDTGGPETPATPAAGATK